MTAWRPTVEVEQRVKLTDKQRRDIDARCPSCWFCGETFRGGGRVVYDHRLALALGGTDARSNIFRLHADPCDKRKTAADKSAIAKVKRLRRRQLEHEEAVDGRAPGRPRVKVGSIKSQGFQTRKEKVPWPKRPMNSGGRVKSSAAPSKGCAPRSRRSPT